MPKASPGLVSFNGGELSPLLDGRVDLDRYGAGLASCENFIPLPQGGLRNRTGTKFVAEIKDSATGACLLPFMYSSDPGQSFMLAVEEPELHIQPSQQKRLVNRLNALCDQTIVTTHSPIVAAMFPAPDTLFVETRQGMLTAKRLIDTLPAQPTNHQQHLLYAWRQKLVAALMHECALIPEGVSDVAWLEATPASPERQRRGWPEVLPGPGVTRTSRDRHGAVSRTATGDRVSGGCRASVRAGERPTAPYQSRLR